MKFGSYVIEATFAALDAIEPRGIEYALFGGITVPLWKHIRATKDGDALIRIEPARLPELVEAMRSGGFAHLPQVNHASLVDVNVYHFWYPVQPYGISIKVDLVTGKTPYHAEVMRRRVPRQIEGRPVWVVTCEDLVLLKLAAERPIDILDAKVLVEMNRDEMDWDYLRAWAKRLRLEPGLADAQQPRMKWGRPDPERPSHLRGS